MTSSNKRFRPGIPVILPVVCFIFFGSVLISHSVQAQRFSWPDKAENLKALPEDTNADQLSNIMRSFTRSLGVRCSHCHVGNEGESLATFDFVSDEKPAKRIAVDMIRMVSAINDTHLANSEVSRTIDVTCVTCHRGVSRPYPIEFVLSNKIEEEGADAAIEEYKALRENYYSSHAYDFSERSLARFGNGLMNSDHPEDGIAFHRLNTDLHPESSIAWQGLASGYEAIGDTIRAISYYGKVLILDPDNDRVARSLKNLK